MKIKNFFNNYKNIIIKVTCYIILTSLLLVCFDFSFTTLFAKKSSLVSAQVSEEMMGVVTNDSYEIIGKVSRVKPQTFGLYSAQDYPSSLNVLKTVDEEKRTSIYNENISMYEDIDLAIEENRLKKHNAADGQFYGVIDDSSEAIIKRVYINTLVKKTHSLGVYAPAGEILEIEVSEELINAGLNIIIGYTDGNNKIPLNRFLEGNQDRMPLIQKGFSITKTTTRVGTPLGGAVYVSIPDSLNKDFYITVSGGVDNPVFQLGVNDEEDFKEMLKAPGLMMEFKLPHIRLIMPKKYAMNSTNVVQALQLWHKMSSLSTYAMNRLGNTLPITHYYDSYVPAGAAVAFVWAWYSILPLDWGSSALNYEAMMTSGNWGNFHEFNHHYQSANYSSGQWGLSDPGEVTNNVLTSLGYILYSDIASTRSETYSPGNGGWNNVVDPYYNLKTVMNNSTNVVDSSELGTNQLYIYTELIHAFGTDKFMNFIRASYGNYKDYTKELMSDVDSFALRASQIFESDLTYFFTNICKMALKEETVLAIQNLNYSPYLPLANLYSKGVENIDTGRAYYLNSNEYTFDFNKYTISPLEYSIEKISKPKKGTLKKNLDGTYSYTNNKYQKDTFQITYKIKYNEETYYKTLDFEIDFSYSNANVKTYSTNESNLDDSINDIKEENLINEQYVSSLNYSVTSGVNVSISNGKLKVDKTGNYVFAVYGDDRVRFAINDKVASSNTYTTNINLNNEESFFTIYLKEGELYSYSLYCLNLGGAGNARVKYSYEEENNYKNIDNKNIYSSKATKETINNNLHNYTIKYDVKNNLIARKYNNLYLNEIDWIETSASPHTSNITDTMFDGDLKTSFHTAWQNNITSFPHEYIIKFKDKIKFNTINFYFMNNNLNYAFSDYEIYISNNDEDYKLISNNSNDQNKINLMFDKEYEARYLKLIIKGNVNNQKYTSISEIEVGNSINNLELNYYGSNNEKLYYIKKWDLDTTKNYFNGVRSVASKNSKVEFTFNGDKLVLYTTSKYRIKVDKEKWEYIDNTGSSNTPTYINNHLDNEEHKVVIEALSDDFSLEMIGVKGEMLKRNSYALSFIEFYKIILSIFFSIILVKGSLYLYDKRRFVTKRFKKFVNKIKENI